ncbi:MAG: hypothetical protein GXO36_03840 [Chloroflexi bacterium]|nr:hypothetical protein [Chloroflexota bacterium]
MLSDQYLIHEPIAQGPWGHIFQAQHRTTGQLFRVKIAHPAAPEQRTAWLAFYERQRQIWARVAHLPAPATHGFLRYIEVGVHDQRPFAVTSWYPQTLEALLGRLSPAQALATAQFLGYWVLQLHRHDVLYGGIAAGNVLLDAYGRPRFVDYGWTLAALQAGLSPQAMSDARRAYLPPESWRGLWLPASDVFGLANLLVAMLTGAPLHIEESTDPKALLAQRVPAWAPVLAPALAPQPEARPSLLEWLASLTRFGLEQGFAFAPLPPILTPAATGPTWPSPRAAPAPQDGQSRPGSPPPVPPPSRPASATRVPTELPDPGYMKPPGPVPPSSRTTWPTSPAYTDTARPWWHYVLFALGGLSALFGLISFLCLLLALFVEYDDGTPTPTGRAAVTEEFVTAPPMMSSNNKAVGLNWYREDFSQPEVRWEWVQRPWGEAKPHYAPDPLEAYVLHLWEPGILWGGPELSQWPPSGKIEARFRLYPSLSPGQKPVSIGFVWIYPSHLLFVGMSTNGQLQFRLRDSDLRDVTHAIQIMPKEYEIDLRATRWVRMGVEYNQRTKMWHVQLNHEPQGSFLLPDMVDPGALERIAVFLESHGPAVRGYVDDVMLQRVSE